MYRTLHPGLFRIRLPGAALLIFTAAAYGIDPGGVKELMAAGKLQEAIGLLAKEVEENPAHEAARILLAEAYEEADKPTDAIDAWQDLIALSRNEANLSKARRAIIRLRR
ncbi:MAG: tetratricopeptide repeat protein, partial [Phycisphaerales bacterium]